MLSHGPVGDLVSGLALTPRPNSNIMRSLCLLFAAVGLASYAIAADFTVTDHGAIGDGRTINTIAIQASIDAAHAAGVAGW